MRGGSREGIGGMEIGGILVDDRVGYEGSGGGTWDRGRRW